MTTEHDEDSRPSRRKANKGGSSLPLILGGVLALGLVGFLLWWFLTGSAASGGAVASWVPGDAQGFATIRVAETWKSETVAKGLQEMRKQPGSLDPVAQLRETVGLAPDEIERLTAVVPDPDGKTMWLIAETVSPLDQDKLKGKLAGASDKDEAGKKYVAGKLPGGGQPSALHFAGPKLLVFGPEEGVKKALAASSKPRTKGPLDEHLALLTGKSHISVAFSVPPVGKDALGELMRNPLVTGFAALAKFGSGTVTFDLASEVGIEASLKYGSDGEADEAKKLADKGLGLATVGLMFYKPAKGDEVTKKAVELAKNALLTIKTDQKGANLVVKGKADGGAVVAALLAVAQQASGPRKAGGRK